MSLFVDTSVWSLAFRRDIPQMLPEVAELLRAIRSRDLIYSTGLVLQEVLQGFAGPKARNALMVEFAPVPLLAPSREDHVLAAELRNHCRRSGVQIGTIDALLAQLCISRDLVMLTADNDFRHAAQIVDLRVWTA